MKHLEVSRRIPLTKVLGTNKVKESIIFRMENAMEVKKVSSQDDVFTVKASTGAPGAVVRHADVSVDYKIIQDKEFLRILGTGRTKVSVSLVLMYVLFVLVILAVGLLPGSIETGDKGSAMDALIFLLIGVYIAFDISKKLTEPKEILEDILQSIDTEFG